MNQDLRELSRNSYSTHEYIVMLRCFTRFRSRNTNDLFRSFERSACQTTCQEKLKCHVKIRDPKTKRLLPLECRHCFAPFCVGSRSMTFLHSDYLTAGCRDLLRGSGNSGVSHFRCGAWVIFSKV